MRKIKFEGRDLPLNASGLAIIICTDELHSDLFKLTLEFLNSVAKTVDDAKDKDDDASLDNLPNASVTSKIMYCFIKSANPDLFKTYTDFMASTNGIKPFVDMDNLNTLCEEISDFYGNEKEEEPKEVSPSNSKKKKAE